MNIPYKTFTDVPLGFTNVHLGEPTTPLATVIRYVLLGWLRVKTVPLRDYSDERVP